jgi:signal transduction histidine kinase
VLVIGYPIVVDNELAGIYALYMDITERMKHQQILEEQNEALRKINKELDMFIYSASHDIRSPLMSILGLVQLAASETNDTEIKGYCSMIEDRIRRLDDFTLDIIHYSRNKRTEPEPVSFSLREAANDIFENLRYNDKARGIDFRLNIEEDLKLVTDLGRLKTVLSNLVSNAIKYQKELTGFVELAAQRTNGNVKITVRDNGEGIDSDKVNTIFEMFTRHSQKSDGSGLGLYIVKEAVEKLRGTIHVESEKGVGSTFEITLPGDN